MHWDNVLNGPLKDAEEDLVRALSADHSSIQKIYQQGADGLPFNVDKPRKLHKRLKEWAQKKHSQPNLKEGDRTSKGLLSF